MAQSSSIRNIELLCCNADELSQRVLHFFLCRCEAALFLGGCFFVRISSFPILGGEEWGKKRGRQKSRVRF